MLQVPLLRADSSLALDPWKKKYIKKAGMIEQCKQTRFALATLGSGVPACGLLLVEKEKHPVVQV